MNKDEQISGTDTIRGLAGGMPKRIKIPFSTQYNQQTLQHGWNGLYVAIIPYCFKCKIPLVWHIHPKNILYHCPKCRTTWEKGEGWKDAEAKVKAIADTVGKDG